MNENGDYSRDKVNGRAKEIISKISDNYSELLDLLCDENNSECPEIGDELNDLGLAIERVVEVMKDY